MPEDKEKFSYKCDECNKVFVGLKAYYVWKHKKQNLNRKGFCSKECAHKKNTKKRLEIKCKTCDKIVKRLLSRIVGEVFCSSNCAAKYNNVKRYISSEKEIKRSITNHKSFARMSDCKNCGIKLQGKSVYQIFCSSKCHKDKQNKDLINRWINKEIQGHGVNLDVRGFVRRYVLNKFNNKCYKCGWGEINPYSETRPLIVDHIDGNSENTFEDNLRLVCPNCDALSCTYKALNRGNGRASRRARYASGKSF